MTIPEPRAVVFVDDDYSITSMLTMVVRRFFPQHPVYTCQTQAQALTYMNQTPVACVITDYYLGHDDGETLALAIHSQWPELPIVLITGLDPTNKALDQRHYVAVLTKPLSIHRLRAVLQPYLLSSSSQ